MKLLIVEDNESLQAALVKGFKKFGYTVDAAKDGEEALELFFANLYSLVLLDLNLPKLDGLEVLREIRTVNQEIPILILSARSQVEEKIAGLDLGANDYLVKPFHFTELEARVRALLRRDFKTSHTLIEIDDVTVDTASKRVFIAETEVVLPKKEYAILAYLTSHRGKSITSTELIDNVWESDVDDAFNSLRVHLSNLRKKLPHDFIKNARGRGYYVE
ncbi:MAG: response regulator transcription factor [Turicibacter sp.]|nr:response regulator transcription factor [Turicibacter sp.]